MNHKKAKLFICQHPESLFFFKNISHIIKRYDRESKIILFKVNHEYFKNFNFDYYKNYFDEIIEFDFVHYEKNIFFGYFRIYKFLKKIKKVRNELLNNFEKIDLFLNDSAWLPTNLLLYNLNKDKNIKSITRFVRGSVKNKQTKISLLKTFLISFYSWPFKKYKAVALTTKSGKFLAFIYKNEVPGEEIKIVTPTKDEPKDKKIIPYPVISNFTFSPKKDIVILFGDNSIPLFYSEYIFNRKDFEEKSKQLLKAIECHYKGCKIYYKPHPADCEKVPDWIDKEKFYFFNPKENAQTILDIYLPRVRAAYSFSSSSIIFSSYLGIPSYSYYKYMCNRKGVEKFDGVFESKTIKSEFICNINSLEKVGEIDNIKRPNFLNINNIGEKYKRILKIN